MNPLIHLKTTPPLPIALALLGFALLPKAQGVVPPPDGGYPGFTTAEGTNALQSLTTGSANTAVGWSSLLSNAAGSFNTATGAGALLFNTVDQNTAFGAAALLFNTTGEFNTAVGTAALLNNTEGTANTADGFQALTSNTTGSNNTANGEQALFSNTTGSGNTANGVQALFSNTTGNNNTANGVTALASNTTGSGNTATGVAALSSNTTGAVNTATGINALRSNTDGIQNTADGFGALANNTIGSANTAVGMGALEFNTTGEINTAIGANALLINTIGTSNIAIGINAGIFLTTGDNNIDIGNSGNEAEANTIRIGQQGTQTATLIAGIRGATVTGTAVVVNGSGQLGVAPSSARFKEAIKSMDNASEALFSLKPVTFRYKQDIDPDRRGHFGLVAEDVEKVNGDLVVRDKEGKPFTVRYDAVNAMLLNEFLKEHHKVQELEATIAQLKSTVSGQQVDAVRQQKQIEALTAGLQKVSAQLEASKPAPQMVNNP